MLASITLAFLLLAILSFLKLVALRSAACEAGPMPYTPDSEAWSAELDVVLGVDEWTGDVDAQWDMVPMAHAWAPLYSTPAERLDRAIAAVMGGRKTWSLQDACLV